MVRGYRCSERRPAVALAALRHVRCVRGHACLLCARVRTSPLLPGPSPRWLKFSCPLPAPPACTSHRREGLPLSSLSLCRSPSQGCFDCELIAGWGLASENQSQETSKGQGHRLSRAAGGWGASRVSSKGTPRISHCHLKAHRQNFGNRGGETSVSKTAIIHNLSPAAWAPRPAAELGLPREGLIINLDLLTKEMLPYYTGKVFFLTASEAVLIITPV